MRLPYLVTGLCLLVLTACQSSLPTQPASESTDREAAAVTVYPSRAWRAAILTCSPDEVTVANYLKTKCATAYPLVQITIIPVTITPDLTNASGAVTFATLFAAVNAAVTPRETAMGQKFQMIQLLHQFPHHVSWGVTKPGSSCGVSTDNRWSTESVLAAGFDAKAATDSPPSMSVDTNIIPFTQQADMGSNWRLLYLTARLEGRTVAEVKAKIDLACATPSTTKPGAIVDGPGKAGSSNNGQGYTYWENMWYADNTKSVASQGTKYGFSTKNDMTGYLGDTNNNAKDDKAEMPVAAFTYITTSMFPVGFLQSYGLHSNGDGNMGTRFTTPAMYTTLPFSPRGVIVGGESFSAYGLDSSHPGYGGTNLGAWLALPVAGYIGPKNEPCGTGIDVGNFVKWYVGQNLTFGEASHAAFHTTKGVWSPFGVAWMTLK